MSLCFFLETGWDILFFWIARMIMLGLKLTGDVPFREVYCHPLVRDSDGRKMSKSLGNVIDPLDVIYGTSLKNLHSKLLSGNLPPTEVAKAKKYQSTAFPQGIPECGVDALRFCLASYTGGGSDINFEISVMHSYRRFCNKIYQAVKYLLGKLDADFTPQDQVKLTGNECLAERWLLHKMTLAAKKMNEALAEREFMKSTTVIYQYFYGNLCDTFIENSKAIIQHGNRQEKRSALDTLYTALESGLLMMHPFMPFLTEELWQRLPRRPGDTTPSIVIAKYPSYDPSLADTEVEAAYELIMACARGVRSMVGSYALSSDAQGKFIGALRAHPGQHCRSRLTIDTQSLYKPTPASLSRRSRSRYSRSSHSQRETSTWLASCHRRTIAHRAASRLLCRRRRLSSFSSRVTSTLTTRLRRARGSWRRFERRLKSRPRSCYFLNTARKPARKFRRPTGRSWPTSRWRPMPLSRRCVSLRRSS